METVFVLITGLLFTTGIILARILFFRLAEDTLAMLNVILETSLEDRAKQKLLIKNLRNLLGSLILLNIFITCLIIISLLPLYSYLDFDLLKLKSFHWNSLSVLIAIAVGSSIPFLVFSFQKQQSDYSDWSKLLHRMMLDNYNIAKALFSIEKKLFSKKTNPKNPYFVIVTGLARSGTSALTTLLYQSKKFHSLNYGNMPFLLSPNCWNKIYKPINTRLKERAHGDKVMFGYNTIEALEEFFFKTFLNDSFILEKTLQEHEVDSNTYQNYLVYQNLLREKTDTMYLSKNNNFILRYKSLRTLNSEFKVVFLFRHPLYHAYSLFKQHQRFSSFHQKDPFTLEYMNWLGHHEFGLNLKHFEFTGSTFPTKYTPDSMNYWVMTWINYYTVILNLEDDKNRMLLHYEDFLEKPRQTIDALSDFIKVKISNEHIASFKNENTYEGEIDGAIEQQAMALYAELLEKKVKV